MAQMTSTFWHVYVRQIQVFRQNFKPLEISLNLLQQKNKFEFKIIILVNISLICTFYFGVVQLLRKLPRKLKKRIKNLPIKKMQQKRCHVVYLMKHRRKSTKYS